MPHVPNYRNSVAPYPKNSGRPLAPECVFLMELVHVATRILVHEGASFMATYHHFSSLNQHRSEPDEALATPVISSGLRQTGPHCNQSARGSAQLAASARHIASICSNLLSLNKRVSTASSESSGANGRTRTADLLFTKQLLCRLSYVG